MSWPTHFPPDCPPQNAGAPSGKVYRLVDNPGPSNSDFRSHREMYPAKPFPDECEACGLSVFKDLSDVARLNRRIPGMRAKVVAEGTLDGSCGKILPTPRKKYKSHHTWWLLVGVQAWHGFSLVVPSAKGSAP